MFMRLKIALQDIGLTTINLRLGWTDGNPLKIDTSKAAGVDNKDISLSLL